ASIQKRSSMKLSLAGKTVDCTRYTWRPRTFSLTRTNRFPSEKRSTSPAPGCMFKYSQILSVSLGLPLPPKMRMSSTIIVTSQTQSLQYTKSVERSLVKKASRINRQRLPRDAVGAAESYHLLGNVVFIGSTLEQGTRAGLLLVSRIEVGGRPGAFEV